MNNTKREFQGVRVRRKLGLGVWLIFYLFIFMCVKVLLACMTVHHVSVWYSGRQEESIGCSLEPELQMVLNLQVGARN